MIFPVRALRLRQRGDTRRVLKWLPGAVARRVEELVGNVGEDASAARGDGPFGNKIEEPGEKPVDVDAGVEFREFGEKFGGEVFRVVLRLGGGGQRGVSETEMGASVQDCETAAATVGGEVSAARLIGRARRVHSRQLKVEK